MKNRLGYVQFYDITQMCVNYVISDGRPALQKRVQTPFTGVQKIADNKTWLCVGRHSLRILFILIICAVFLPLLHQNKELKILVYKVKLKYLNKYREGGGLKFVLIRVFVVDTVEEHGRCLNKDEDLPANKNWKIIGKWIFWFKLYFLYCEINKVL